MINFTIDTDDAIKKVTLLFGDINDALDPEEILDDAAALMLSRTIRRFRNQETPEGVKWRKSEAAKIRQAGGYTWSNGKRVTGGYTLYATGRLFESFDIVDQNVEGQRRIVNTAPYSAYLNGGEWQFMGASEQDIQLMVNLVYDRIEKALRQNG